MRREIKHLALESENRRKRDEVKGDKTKGESGKGVGHPENHIGTAFRHKDGLLRREKPKDARQKRLKQLLALNAVLDSRIKLNRLGLR